MRVSGRLYHSLAASYLGLVVGPVLPAIAALAGISELRWLLFSTGALLGAGVGYIAASRIDTVRWLTTDWFAVGIAVLPLLYVVWIIALLAHNPGRNLITLFGRPGTAGVFAFGIGVTAVTLANRQRCVERIERTNVYTSFTARPSKRLRRVRYMTFAVGLGVIVGLLITITISGRLSAALLLAVLFVAPASLFGLRLLHRRTVVITEDGVAVDSTFTTWDHFEEYEVSDDALVLSLRTDWVSDLAFDAGDITTIADVQDALEKHLQEQDF